MWYNIHMKEKNNVIPFPMDRIPGSKEEKELEQHNIFEDSVSLAQYIFEGIDAMTQSEEIAEYLNEFDAKAEGTQENKDMWVILNMLAAVIVRNKGGDHFFIRELDHLYKELKMVDAGFEPLDEDGEIWFEPWTKELEDQVDTEFKPSTPEEFEEHCRQLYGDSMPDIEDLQETVRRELEELKKEKDNDTT